MYYVYILRSIPYPDQMYVGFTRDISERFIRHNQGGSLYTKTYKPWKLIVYLSFESEQLALHFERYLKSAAGKAFAFKRFFDAHP